VPNGTSASTKPLARPVTRDVSSFITGADAEGNHKEHTGKFTASWKLPWATGVSGAQRAAPIVGLFSILRAELYVVANAWAKTCAGLGHVCLRYGLKSRFVSSALPAVAAPPVSTAVESPMRDTTFARLLRE
jgi:hypothetical protein